MRDEMRILRGETTQFGLELERLAQAGATRQDLQQLQMMEMHRQRILFLQEQERKKQQAIADQVERAARAQEQQQQAMQNRAESIIESLKSPTDKLRERQAEIASLRAANLLTALQAQQALQKAEDDFAGPKAPIKPAEFQAASAMQKGSQEAFSAILRSMQTKDPQVAAINKMDKNLASKMDEMTGAILTIQTAGVA
jgi:esterase/lipase